MKILNLLLAVIVLSFSLILSGCDLLVNEQEKAFLALLKDPNVSDINHSIKMIIDPTTRSDFEPMGNIYFIISNHSGKMIRFPPDDNVQIFLFSEESNTWEQVKNAVTYMGEDMRIVPYGSEGGTDINTTLIRPDYQSNGKEQRMRVAVTGYVVKDGQPTDEAVSAYIQFKMRP